MTGERRSWWAFGCSDQLTDRDRANLRRVNLYWVLTCLAWVGTLFLIARKLVPAAGAILVIVPTILVVISIRQMVQFLRGADELTRRIQYRGMAVGFAAGLVATLMQVLAVEVTELLGLGFELQELFMPLLWMSVAYPFTVVRLQIKYSR